MKIHPKETNTSRALVPKLRIKLCLILTLAAMQIVVLQIIKSGGLLKYLM